MNTDSQSRARSLASAFLLASLTLGMAACGDDDENASSAGQGVAAAGMEAAAGMSSAAGMDTAAGMDATAGMSGTGGTGGGEAGAGQCMDDVYADLGDECKACLCEVDPMVAPSCNENCWIFLACSFNASAAACLGLESGTPEQQDCIMAECGEQLAAPGAQLISGFSEAGLVAACAVPGADGAGSAACLPDVGRLISEL